MLTMDQEALDALGAAINAAAGRKLRGLRAEKLVSRAQLKERTGLGISTIQRIENGETSPTIQQLVLILNALDKSLKDFVADALKDVPGIE